MVIITPKRVRSMLADCKNEAEVASTLRYHGVKFRYSTDSGFLSILVPCCSGTVRIFRTASKVCPMVMTSVAPVPYRKPLHVTGYRI